MRYLIFLFLVITFNTQGMAQEGLTSVKINELATRSLNSSDYFIKGEGSLMYKNTLGTLANFIGSVGVLGYQGALAIADTPTEDGFYFASESGNYTNAGGLVVDLNEGINIISVTEGQTVFEKVVVPVDSSGFLLDSDLTISVAPNRFDRSRIVQDTYVGSGGNILTGAGWQMISIPLAEFEATEGTEITISDIFVLDPGYWAFYVGDQFDYVSNGSFTSGSTFTITVPPLAGWLHITIKRNSDSESVYEYATVTKGSSKLSPYEPYRDSIISAIKGYDVGVGSGESYDQDLNTYNDVSFASLTANALSLDIPQGMGTPPPEVEIGDAWIDTSDSNSIKVRMV